MKIDMWTWKCLRCGWAVESARTVNNQQAVADVLVRVHIQQHDADDLAALSVSPPLSEPRTETYYATDDGCPCELSTGRRLRPREVIELLNRPALKPVGWLTKEDREYYDAKPHKAIDYIREQFARQTALPAAPPEPEAAQPQPDKDDYWTFQSASAHHDEFFQAHDFKSLRAGEHPHCTRCSVPEGSSESKWNDGRCTHRTFLTVPAHIVKVAALSSPLPSEPKPALMELVEEWRSRGRLDGRDDGTAAEYADELEQALAASPVSAVPPTPARFTENEIKDVLTALYQDGHVDLVLADRIAALLSGTNVLTPAVQEPTALKLAQAALHYPPNGHHYCRWCSAGTSNGWQHLEGCGYVSQCADIDAARAAIAAALGASRPSPADPDSAEWWRDVAQKLGVQLHEAKLAHECSEAVLSMAVSRLGGLVEGQPTLRINFLQRIDALVAAEAGPSPAEDEIAVGQVWSAPDGRKLRVAGLGESQARIAMRNVESNRLTYMDRSSFDASQKWHLTRIWPSPADRQEEK